MFIIDLFVYNDEVVIIYFINFIIHLITGIIILLILHTQSKHNDARSFSQRVISTDPTTRSRK